MKLIEHNHSLTVSGICGTGVNRSIIMGRVYAKVNRIYWENGLMWFRTNLPGFYGEATDGFEYFI